MINKKYKLVSPYEILEKYEEINYNLDSVLIKPTKMAICHADQRYYQGNRDEKVLSQKLPMALIHEAVGEVIYDKLGEYKKGDKVVMIPNTPVENSDKISENYLQSSKFRSSGYDGFMQEFVSMRRDRIIKIGNISEDTAVFAELLSVSMHAIHRMNKLRNIKTMNNIAVWGNGVMGYMICGLLDIMYPDTNVYIIGRNKVKNIHFTTTKKALTINEIKSINFEGAFECVGGNQSEIAINQIIDNINPEGVISVLGVPDHSENINMRMVLEKGLIIYGSSRSGYSEFKEVIDLLNKSDNLRIYLELLKTKEYTIKNINDIHEAFLFDKNKTWGKTILNWNI